jgi:hypothetical protein
MIDLSKKDADGKPFLEKYLLRKAGPNHAVWSLSLTVCS